MDFLRQHLPGLHQALRGALDSLSTFVSYLIGDEVPTVVREEQTAQVLEEVATGKPEKILEEEAWEVVEGLRGSQSEGVGGLGGSGRVGTCGEGSSAEQTWGWRAGTSCGSQAEKQETGAWEAVKGQEPNDPLEVGKESEAVPETQPDRSSGAPENSKEVSEKEVSREQTPRTWEQKEEEEDGWVTEQGMARGVESQLTWQGKPEQSVDADGPKVADGQRDEQVEEEAATETKGLGMKETTREEMGVMVVWSGESSSVLESTQGPGTDSEDWIASSNEEARIAPGREEMDFSEVQEAESRLVSGQRSPRVWVLEEAPKRDQEEEVDERGNVERNILLKQTQALGPKGTEEAADGLTTERKTAGQKPEEAGEVSEGEDDLCGKETDGRPDIAISVEEASLEEVVQVEETQREEGHYQDSDANLVLYNEAVDKADVEAIPEATSEEECIEERNEEAHKSLKALEVKVTENQEPEPMGGTQTPVGQPEEAQRDEDELERDPILSEEWVERRLEAYPQHPGPADPELPEAETWENRSKKGTESRNVQEEKDAEGEEEEAASQALKAEAEGKPLSGLLEIQTYGTEKGQASIIENQVLEERKGDEAEPGQSLTESEARKSKADEVEATMPGGADNGGCRLEKVILSLQDSQDPGTSSWDAEVMEDEAGEGPVKEADVSWEKAFERGWESKGQEKVIEGEKQCEQEIGTVDSAEEPTGQSSHPEAGEAKEKEQAEAGESTMAEGTEEMGDTGSGSQEARAEETEALVQAEELLEEAGGGQVREPREGSEGQCGDHHPEGEAQKLPGMEDHVTEDLTLEAQETEPEALENAQEQEGQLPPQVSAGAVPVPSETMEAVESTRGDPGNGWSEALLPGSLLDVSVPRSRVLLSRSSSQRRSRPSFRRSLVTEQQDDIPCAQPQPGPSSPEPRPLQLEEAPEPSPPKPEGTPVPARRRPVGGFGIAHPGMMQELQARLARPKPQ